MCPRPNLRQKQVIPGIKSRSTDEIRSILGQRMCDLEDVQTTSINRAASATYAVAAASLMRGQACDALRGEV